MRQMREVGVESVPLIGGGGAPELVPAGDPPGAVEMPAGAVPATAMSGVEMPDLQSAPDDDEEGLKFAQRTRNERLRGWA